MTTLLDWAFIVLAFKMKKVTKKLRHCYGLNYVHEKYKSLPPLPQNVTLVGSRVFLTDVISYDEVSRVGPCVG